MSRLSGYVAAGAPTRLMCCTGNSTTSSSWRRSSTWARSTSRLIKLLLGPMLIARWEMWQPAIHVVHGWPGVVIRCSMSLVAKMKIALASTGDGPRTGHSAPVKLKLNLLGPPVFGSCDKFQAALRVGRWPRSRRGGVRWLSGRGGARGVLVVGRRRGGAGAGGLWSLV